MSERVGYQPGVPCWVDTWQPDPEAAVGFYTQLFGWEAEDRMPPDSPGQYFMCKLRGRGVAAIGSQPPEHAPVWDTYISVDRADDTAAKVTDAGGSVVIEPFDLLDAGRMAVLSDPSGAVFCVWQAKEHRGAQLVNEPGAWAMSQLNTRDPEAVKAFYGAMFGWSTEEFGEGITLWRLPGYEGGEPEQPVSREVVATMGERFPADVPPHWSVNFWVADTDAIADKAAELGGKVVVPPHSTPVSRDAVLADPQGAVFSVSKVIGR
jgi:predicted enzyme related to lactoylglutathione lyase